MNYDIHRTDDDSHSIRPAEIVVRQEREDRRRDRSWDQPRVINIDGEEDRHNISGHDGRRDSPRVRIFDNDGDHYIIRGREREAEPTYTNAQTTASKYYEGGFGDRAWRKKKLERIGRRHLPFPIIFDMWMASMSVMF